jgi:nucleoside-diphosphate-sugar epimerase
MTSITSKSMPKDCPVLLLGATGRLGRMIRRHWPDRDGLTLQSRGAQPGMLCLDPLRDGGALKAAASGMRAVVCLSGVTPAHAAASGDRLSLNADLALAAIAAAPSDVRVFVISSAAVYGAAVGPHSETDTVTPQSAYGEAKLHMEHAVLAQGEGQVCVLRVGNVVGADAIVGNWRAGMTLDQMPDGRTPRRSYIGERTLARVMHALCAASSVPDVLNIAAPGLVEMGDLLDRANLAWAPRTPVGSVIEEVALDTCRLEQVYSFSERECTAAGMVEQWTKGQSLK